MSAIKMAAKLALLSFVFLLSSASGLTFAGFVFSPADEAALSGAATDAQAKGRALAEKLREVRLNIFCLARFLRSTGSLLHDIRSCHRAVRHSSSWSQLLISRGRTKRKKRPAANSWYSHVVDSRCTRFLYDYCCVLRLRLVSSTLHPVRTPRSNRLLKMRCAKQWNRHQE